MNECIVNKVQPFTWLLKLVLLHSSNRLITLLEFPGRMLEINWSIMIEIKQSFKKEWCFAPANQIILSRLLEKHKHMELRACLPNYLRQCYILPFVYYHAQIVQMSFNCLVNISKKRSVRRKKRNKKSGFIYLWKMLQKTGNWKIFYIPKMYFFICCIP